MQDSALLFFGLLLLLSGGEALVRGASSLARSLGISPLAIGLTVVAMGTSAPELAVNRTAAVEGKTDLSVGNVFGSNMANVGLVIGVCGLVRALRIQSIVVSREIPMMLLGTFVLVIVDMFLLRLKVRRQLIQRFPGEDYKGTTYYTITRSLQMKFLRLPKPQVKIGQPLPDTYR